VLFELQKILSIRSSRFSAVCHGDSDGQEIRDSIFIVHWHYIGLHTCTQEQCRLLFYCSVVWHHSLSKVWKLYSVEPSVLSPVTVGMPYIFALSYTQIPSLHSRREDANKRFFRDRLSPYLLHSFPVPPQRDSTITSRLRSAAIYPRPATRIKRFTSSVQYFLV